ncbi:MAG: radical SAM protein [Burkholderiales bacterium]|nr:radical SAM protein [Burkholderiales bacterium]
MAPVFTRNIHLLYSPTLACNLSCRYCYLGEQTTTAGLKNDAARAVDTLRFALDALRDAGVLAFNVSLHGGEVTALPPLVLEDLFKIVRQHYLQHFDEITALGHKKSSPHIKTNLFKFASLYDLLDRHKVSVSASIDLPLSMHAKYRTTRSGGDWLARTLDNIRLLARYPHGKKISATICSEHLTDIPAFIKDIWFIHRELGFDMNQFNLMFAFASELNDADKGKEVLTPTTPAEQKALYDALKAEFTGTELEEGLRRNWFDEFKPSYCTNAFNCGERFYLLQSDGSVYSCVRGQGIEEFKYGNVFEDRIDDILANGARKISQIHQTHGFDDGCGGCNQLSRCHTGCAVVKHQSKSGRSYTCDLQKMIYRDNPRSFPADSEAKQKNYARYYARAMHPQLSFDAVAAQPAKTALIPDDLRQEKNSLQALIDADPVLQTLYSADAFTLAIGDELVALRSQLFKTTSDWHTLSAGDPVKLHFRRALFDIHCDEPTRNTLYLQMLRDTPVVYGDDQRSKQAHLFTYQIYADHVQQSDRLGADFVMVDLSDIIGMHRHLYQHGVLNNLFFTTLYLRDYHYQKQKNNAFYHIQAVNLPFQNFEFFYLAK